MTKKNYELIAKAMNECEPTNRYSTYTHLRQDQWSVCCHALANALGRDNPKFNRQRFIAACNGKDDPQPAEPLKPVKLKSQYKG